MNIFEDRESNVRSYCRSFPAVFTRAKGALVYSESGKEYLDFFAAAGSLNYGHNNDSIKRKLLSYLEGDGIVHSLDMYTTAKKEFLEAFTREILKPRGLDYKVQFCGPTGTNAVEAALKLVRKVKHRVPIFSFMGGYHGVSSGSLSVTASLEKRAAAGLPLSHAVFLPYPSMPHPSKFMERWDSIEYLEAVLNDSHSGIERPAAVILETVQAEGGVYVAPIEWLQRLRRLCDEQDILLICDEIQVGCGRTGPFFSFERANIAPDLVTLSKSISGYGGPMSLLLMKPQLDVWQPAEHNGTFRGYQLSLVGATAALEYRKTINLEFHQKEKETFLESFLKTEIRPLADSIDIRGVGMIWGVDFSREPNGPDVAKRIAARCFELGLIIERAGRGDTVLKIMPPLTIEMALLKKGCSLIARAIKDCTGRQDSGVRNQDPEVRSQESGISETCALTPVP
jgi:diaminobutyrate-2-oxoglutarate transaminase